MEILVVVSKYVVGFCKGLISWRLKNWRDRTKTEDELTRTRKLLLVELGAVLDDFGELELLDPMPTLKCDFHRSLEKGIADLTLSELRAVEAAYKEICKWNSVCAGERFIIESSHEHPRDRVAYRVPKAIEELKIGLGIDD